MKMHWRILLALSLVAMTSAAPSMNLEDSGDESENDVLKFHSSLEVDRQWKSFKSTYEKEYGDDAEELLRKNIFAKNLKTIEEHNQLHAKGLKTFTLGVNQFADLELHEFVKQMTCLPPGKHPEVTGGSAFVPPEVNFTPSDSVDWRKCGAVTDVKNQGNCGSCYAFSATGALEGLNFRKTGHLVSLSEQNLIDCTSVHYGNQGCGGGWPFIAYQYVIYNKGVDKEKAYAYEEKVGSCRYDPTHIGGNCTGWVWVTPGSEIDLQTALASYGPISVGIDAHQLTFMLYKQGVYNEPRCNATNLNHAVLVVGYGSTETNPKLHYWIVKNSYGAEYGMKGYILMSRNLDNQCGIASMATYPVG